MVTASGPLPGATEGAYRGAPAYFAKVNAEGASAVGKITVLKGDDGLDPQRARGEFLRLEPQVFAFVGSLAVADSGYVDLVALHAGALRRDVRGSGRPRGSTTCSRGRPPNVAHTGSVRVLPPAVPQREERGLPVRRRRRCPRPTRPTSREPIKRVGFNIVYDSGAQSTAPRLHGRGHQHAAGAGADGVPVRLRGEHAHAPGAQHAPAELRAAAQGRQHRLQLEADRAAGRHLQRVEEPHRLPADAQRGRAGPQPGAAPSSSRGTNACSQAPRSTCSPSTVGRRPRCSPRRCAPSVPTSRGSGCSPRSNAIKRTDGGGIRGPTQPEHGGQRRVLHHRQDRRTASGSASTPPRATTASWARRSGTAER